MKSLANDITVVKKNQNEMIIPFHQSPKIIISTNYTIAGSDDSTLVRQFEVEFSDHYNTSHRPIDEFGHSSLMSGAVRSGIVLIII